MHVDLSELTVAETLGLANLTVCVGIRRALLRGGRRASTRRCDAGDMGCIAEERQRTRRLPAAARQQGGQTSLLQSGTEFRL